MRFNVVVPNENRREQTELRLRLGLKEFLDRIWNERQELQPYIPSTGKWPIERSRA